MEQEEVEVLVVGAGPSGLAMGACLSRANVPFVLLEGSERVADAWHRHYERLHLHTARRHSGLPFLPMPVDWSTYPSRLQVIEYLSGYAKSFDLRVRLGEEVSGLANTAAGWAVTSSKRGYLARRVVLTTGYNRVPVVPSRPDRSLYQGQVLHSSEYKNGVPFSGQRVLVVGLGNSGGEIALDLLEHGALPTLSVRSGVNVIPRDVFGRPAQQTGILLERLNLPLVVQNAIARVVSRAAFGDLSRYGLRPASVGVASQIARGRIPLIDVGTVARIKRGELLVRPDIARFWERGVVFTDGQQESFDAIVLATGYTTGLARLFASSPAIFDSRGCPRPELGDEPLPGLHFLGFVNPPTGFLRRIGIDARRLAAHIAAAGARPTHRTHATVGLGP